MFVFVSDCQCYERPLNDSLSIFLHSNPYTAVTVRNGEAFTIIRILSATDETLGSDVIFDENLYTKK